MKELADAILRYLERVDVNVEGLRPLLDPERIYSGCRQASVSLQNRGLIYDPPWLKLPAVLLILGLSLLPVDFSVKTDEGMHMVRMLNERTYAYDFYYARNAQERNFRFKLLIGDFVGQSIAHIANEYLRYWDQFHAAKPAVTPTVRRQRGPGHTP